MDLRIPWRSCLPCRGRVRLQSGSPLPVVERRPEESLHSGQQGEAPSVSGPPEPSAAPSEEPRRNRGGRSDDGKNHRGTFTAEAPGLEKFILANEPQCIKSPHRQTHFKTAMSLLLAYAATIFIVMSRRRLLPRG